MDDSIVSEKQRNKILLEDNENMLKEFNYEYKKLKMELSEKNNIIENLITLNKDNNIIIKDKDDKMNDLLLKFDSKFNEV